MSDQINSNEFINDLSERDAFNDYLTDNEQYCLLNGNFDHPNNNIDNLMDNENLAAPVPLRRREIDNSINNNIFNESYQNGLNIGNSENEEKYFNKDFINNDFSCFNPNFLESDKDMLLVEHDNDVDKENNDGKYSADNERIVPLPDDREKNYIGVERITPCPGINEINNNPNMNNIMEAPIINSLLYSSQNINTACLSNSSSSQVNLNQNSLNFSSQNQMLTPNSEKNEKTSTPSDPVKSSQEDLSLTKENNHQNGTTTKTKNKKKPLRKFKPDSLRKKIKARMHKKLRDIINKKLVECGSKMIFDYFPQPFITNVNVMHNKAYLKLTMRTLIKMVFGNKPKDREKAKTNIKTLNYLDSNDDIRIKSGAEDYLNSTYEDIIINYINGKFFEEDVNKLYEEGESQEYIDKYKFIGKHWIEFYNNNGKIYVHK